MLFLLSKVSYVVYIFLLKETYMPFKTMFFFKFSKGSDHVAVRDGGYIIVKWPIYSTANTFISVKKLSINAIKFTFLMYHSDFIGNFGCKRYVSIKR